jgi:hypothetical protein
LGELLLEQLLIRDPEGAAREEEVLHVPSHHAHATSLLLD